MWRALLHLPRKNVSRKCGHHHPHLMSPDQRRGSAVLKEGAPCEWTGDDQQQQSNKESGPRTFGSAFVMTTFAPSTSATIFFLHFPSFRFRCLLADPKLQRDYVTFFMIPHAAVSSILLSCNAPGHRHRAAAKTRRPHTTALD